MSINFDAATDWLLTMVLVPSTGPNPWSGDHRDNKCLYDLLTEREHAWILAATALGNWQRCQDSLNEAFKIRTSNMMLIILNVAMGFRRLGIVLSVYKASISIDYQ